MDNEPVIRQVGAVGILAVMAIRNIPAPGVEDPGA